MALIQNQAGLEALFAGLCDGTVPGATYGLGKLVGFARSAVKQQRDESCFAIPGSWAIVPDIEGMPSDARHDFIMRTTWYVTAILSWLQTNRPEAAAEVSGLDAAIQAGARFSTLNGFRGHGYDGPEGILEALRLFDVSGLIAQAVREPERHPEVRALLRELKCWLLEQAAVASDEPSWGHFGRKECEGALGLLVAVDGV